MQDGQTVEDGIGRIDVVDGKLKGGMWGVGQSREIKLLWAWWKSERGFAARSYIHKKEKDNAQL